MAYCNAMATVHLDVTGVMGWSDFSLSGDSIMTIRGGIAGVLPTFTTFLLGFSPCLFHFPYVTHARHHKRAITITLGT
ncbi:hypothetical protein BU16DRAFT_361277 [Lophium mytilinum]|uniref:Uncharacterized protein n=1 Tax=Lophium mytilinum TaxID=390894 RepID=A0A6A6QUZ4_9PEZI|nr:hypothetical protein BU16DRAFT_361277 [Lophium mytilinum]